MHNLAQENPSQDKTIIDKSWTYSRAYSSLNISAKFKCQPADFVVEENNTIEFSGEGEHCWLYIKKRGCNTDWVAQQLAKYCGVKQNAVSYAGLKDRHAVTSQWFSVQLPGLPTPQWDDFNSVIFENTSAGTSAEQSKERPKERPEERPEEQVEIVECYRHNRKLQRGALKSNTFKITLRELSKVDENTFIKLEQRCDVIAQNGVPNYFGPQRFGRGFNNLDQAVKMFSGSGFSQKNSRKYKLSRQKRGLYLSAARSWMFNRILSERVELNVWQKRLPGDVFMLDGKSACFKDEAENAILIEGRLARNEIHPTAVLWGDGDPMVTAQAADLEAKIISQFPVYRDGLKSARVDSQRRACRVVAGDFKYYREADDFVVSFTLPPGSYATVVLAEIFSELSDCG